MSTSNKRRRLIHRLTNKAYRDAYVAQHSTIGLPFQIRAMRDARQWTQRELGERAEMKQETISLLENPGYGKFTLRTLNRLAAAFDVGLLVRFVPFSRLVDEMTDVAPEQLAVPSFDADTGLRDDPPVSTDTATTGRTILATPAGLAEMLRFHKMIDQHQGARLRRTSSDRTSSRRTPIRAEDSDTSAYSALKVI